MKASRRNKKGAKLPASTVAPPAMTCAADVITPVAHSTTGKKLSMKLLVDNRARRVLYAEADKDVVDFLFSLLTLPIATISSILTPGSMVGSVGNLYGSVEGLEGSCICGDDAKTALLAPAGGCENVKLLQIAEVAEAPLKTSVVYRCDNYKCKTTDYVAEECGTPCPYCWRRMITPVQLLELAAGSDVWSAPRGSSAAAGFVRGMVTYNVMDDLKVAPMSNISGITQLNTFGVTDIGSLQEKTVQLGYAEGLEILKASLQSKTVLTDVFLAKTRK